MPLVFILLIPVLLFLAHVFVKLSEDRLRKYRDILGLEKANLVYMQDYQKLREIIVPTRGTAFDYEEPIIWLYRKNGSKLFLGAKQSGDLRIWLTPKTVLQNVHIVLDSRLNNGMRTNLLKDKLPPQQIDLEGNFPEHFTLYCNEGQQIIALQIIAPDIMAYILDNLLDADIEILNSQVAIIIKNGAKSLDRLKASIELARRIDTLALAAAKVTRL